MYIMLIVTNTVVQEKKADFNRFCFKVYFALEHPGAWTRCAVMDHCIFERSYSDLRERPFWSHL